MSRRSKPPNVPPAAIEAEQAVLGTVFQRPEVVPRLAGSITATEFYRDAHRHIYAAMIALVDTGQPVDYVTVIEHLRVRGYLDEVGGPAYVASLGELVPSAANIDHYVGCIQRAAAKRRLTQLADYIRARVADDDNPDAIRADLLSEVEQIGGVAAPSLIPAAVDIMQAFWAAPPLPDYVLPGLLAGTVGALIAPGATGKSYWALQAAIGIASDQPGSDLLALMPAQFGRVLYLAAEDPPDEIDRRLHAIGRHLPPASREAVAARLELLPALGRRLDIMDTRIMREMITRGAGARLIVLDTISRFHGLDENSNTEMARLISALEHLAVETGAAVMYLHHAAKWAARDGCLDQQQAARGASALIDNARWAGYVARMSQAEAARQADRENGGKPVGDDRRGYYIKFGLGKQNYGTPLPERWYRRVEGGVLVPAKLVPVATAGGTRKVVPMSRHWSEDDDDF